MLPDTVDVLVNCAGGNTDFDRAGPDDLASLAANWRVNLETNLLSAVLTAAVADRLTDGGAVISLDSIAADNGAGAYGAAKAALASWNIDLARELGTPDHRAGPRRERRSPHHALIARVSTASGLVVTWLSGGAYGGWWNELGVWTRVWWYFAQQAQRHTNRSPNDGR